MSAVTKPARAKAQPKRRPSRGRPRGRPKGSGLTLTPEITKAITDALALAMPFDLACGCAGVPPRTGRDWKQRGEAGEAPYLDFVASVTRARCEAARHLTVRALGGGKGSSQATWFLERRYAEHYGPVQRVEHSGPGGRPISIEARPLSQMSDEELLRIAEQP